MEEMKVLSLSRINLSSFSSTINLSSFSSTLKLPKKLKTLHLDFSDVRDISVVGELTNLEILCICYCQRIEELPADIGRLNRLRLLELRGCVNLERVAEGVISSLVRLEELKIVGGFNQWGAKVNGSEERNASLVELGCLPNLTCLEIDICESNLEAQEICLSQPLVRYRICFLERSIMEFERLISLNIPDDMEYQRLVEFDRIMEFERLISLNLPDDMDYKRHISPNFRDDMEYERFISLILPGDIAVGNWIHKVVRSTQLLQLTGDGSSYLNLAEIESLRKLIFTNCSTVEFMVDGTIPEGFNFFQNLEVLYVNVLPKLAHLWRNPNQNVSLRNLKKIIVFNCPNLRALFPLETARSLVQLQLLKIHNCGTIEQVFSNEIEDEGNGHMIFPKLEVLKLRDLPCLTTTFYRGVESIKFPKLELVQIVNLPRLNEFAPMDSEPSHDDRCLHFFCNPKVEFSCLHSLYIGKLRDTINKIWCRLIPNNFFYINGEQFEEKDMNGGLRDHFKDEALGNYSQLVTDLLECWPNTGEFLFQEKDLNGGLRDHFKSESQKGGREKTKKGGRKRKHRGCGISMKKTLRCARFYKKLSH